MEKVEVIQPIKTTLDGLNYAIWSQEMPSFLKGKRLWRIVSDSITKPVKENGEDDKAYWDRLQDWDSKNHQILTWIRNTSIPSITLQFARFETDKEVWELLSTRYYTTNVVHQYQLHEALHNMKQVPGQSINEFLSQMQPIWDQLALSEPSFENTKDANKIFKYRDNLRVMQFLMALTRSYEPVRASILHRGSLPILEAALSELLSEETRLNILDSQSNTTDTSNVLAAPYKAKNSDKLSAHSDKFSEKFCNYCRNSGHIISECRKLKFKNKNRGNTHFKGQQYLRQCQTAGAMVDEPTPTFSLGALETILRQLTTNSNQIASSSQGSPQRLDSTTSLALSVTPSTSSPWFFDSGCCNHMTSKSAVFAFKTTPVKTPVIHTADNSELKASYVGNISTSNLTLTDAFLVPRLSLNLI